MVNTLTGVDISSIQEGFNSQLAYQQGYRFVVIKASGGKSYKNLFRASQATTARQADMLVGFYHYMWEPMNGSGSADVEFANFRDAVKPYWRPGNTLWLDVEEHNPTVNVGDMLAWILRFQDLCYAEFGFYPGIYTGTYFIQAHNLYDSRLTRGPLWMASWQAEVPGAVYRKPWRDVTIWQYDAYRYVAGKQTDTDLFYGTAQDWEALGTPVNTILVKQPVASQEDEVKEPAARTATAYINAKGETLLVANLGGNASVVEGFVFNDAGATVRNPDGERFSGSLNSKGFTPWLQLSGVANTIASGLK